MSRRGGFSVTLEQFLIQHDRPGQGSSPRRHSASSPKSTNHGSWRSPDSFPKQPRPVNIQLATMVLAWKLSKFLAWPRIDLLAGTVVAVHRRRIGQTACQSRKWGHGNQAAGL